MVKRGPVDENRRIVRHPAVRTDGIDVVILVREHRVFPKVKDVTLVDIALPLGLRHRPRAPDLIEPAHKNEDLREKKPEVKKGQ